MWLCIITADKYNTDKGLFPNMKSACWCVAIIGNPTAVAFFSYLRWACAVGSQTWVYIPKKILAIWSHRINIAYVILQSIVVCSK